MPQVELDVSEFNSQKTQEIPEQRTIFIDGDIRQGTGTQVIQGLLDLQNVDPIKDITMLINSPGGDVYELMACLDMMEIVPNDIRTIVIGKAMSAGALIAICGTKGKRFMTKNSTLMLHSVSGAAVGNVKDVKIEIEEIKRLNNEIIKMISSNSKLSIKEVKDLIDRDKYILPTEAIKMGLIDAICAQI